MANSGQLPANLPVFDGKHYDRWTIQMKVVFRYQEVLEVVNNGVVPTEGNALRDQQKKDSKALFIIHQCVNPDVFESISEFETAKEAWDALATTYAGDASLKKVRLQNLRRQYENLKMEEADTVASYLGKVTAVTNQMRTNGKTITNQEKVEKVLCTLTPKFDSVVTAIEQSKNLETLKFEELQGSLEVNEARLKLRTDDKEKEKAKEKAVEEALQAKFGKNNNNWKKKGKGNWKDKNPRIGNSDESDNGDNGKGNIKKVGKRNDKKNTMLQLSRVGTLC